MTEIDLYLNRIAQGLVSESAAYVWFEGQEPSNKKHILLALSNICMQAHPLLTEVPKAIEQSGLKPTFTPCVLLMQASSPEGSFGKIVSLPAIEQAKSFRLLISLFIIADTRRRETDCKNGCTHAWHNLPAL